MLVARWSTPFYYGMLAHILERLLVTNTCFHFSL